MNFLILIVSLKRDRLLPQDREGSLYLSEKTTG